MKTGERIRQLRQAINLTQAKFAERIGISASYVAEIELGNKTATDRIMRLISMEFSVDEHWLRTGKGKMYNENVDTNIAKINSLFKSLSPWFQECAMVQLNSLTELYLSNDE